MAPRKKAEPKKDKKIAAKAEPKKARASAPRPAKAAPVAPVDTAPEADATTVKPALEASSTPARTRAKLDQGDILGDFDSLTKKLEASSKSLKQPRQLRWALKTLALARAAAERYIATA